MLKVSNLDTLDTKWNIRDTEEYGECEQFVNGT